MTKPRRRRQAEESPDARLKKGLAVLFAGLALLAAAAAEWLSRDGSQPPPGATP